MSQTTLCIPRLETHISNDYIRSVFSKLKLGEIKRITDVPLKNDRDFKRIFIQVAWNPRDPSAEYIYDRICKGEDVKIVYNQPWYWKVVSCR
jgi:hypothetical protein